MAKHILIVDDSPLSRVLIAKAVECEGSYQITQLDNGNEAINHVRNCEVDCMFLDLTMPEVTGYDVLEALSDSNVPIVVITADRQKETARRLRELGAATVILKPPSRDSIRKVLAGI